MLAVANIVVYLITPFFKIVESIFKTTEKKYIIVDLELAGLMPGMGNLGQVILVNQAYEG